ELAADLAALVGHVAVQAAAQLGEHPGGRAPGRPDQEHVAEALLVAAVPGDQGGPYLVVRVMRAGLLPAGPAGLPVLPVGPVPDARMGGQGCQDAVPVQVVDEPG